ncbi:hypothetical protein [Dysgonomonas gadei]|uniref:Uncharacterized protein n=1 Tax=Dysgonomonas gadei ATCC BAA-286 TaxID=742766 RepID=F5IWY1_9BACT|nr:hypothetical protein [Dysgonomonas gadei]EGK02328.1 hypothetical protein HMPREF9455_01598 [Dysgonomonas gadei ATCC BAA-286]
MNNKTLIDGEYIFLGNMNKKDDYGLFSSFVFLNDDKNKIFFTAENPDELVKYGKYEMRVRDKILVETGFVTKAKVKWRGSLIINIRTCGKKIKRTFSIRNHVSIQDCRKLRK